MADEIRSASRDLSGLRLRRDAAPPRSRRVPLLVAALLLAAGGGLWLFRAGRGKAPVVETGLVRLVGSSEGSAILSASGYILPDRKADVSSKAFGRLEWVGVNAGSVVQQGEVIARLASADVAAQVEEAKVALHDAEREHARWKRIVDDGLEPRERLDKAETALHIARARLKQSEAALEYTLVRAPFDGVVVKRLAQAGETVGPAGAAGGTGGGAVCTLVDRASLEMVADVNEANISKVKAGQPVEVTADARPERRYRGQVRQIVPTADRQKGIVQVKVRILDLDEGLLPEMAARAAFLREGAEGGRPKRVIAPRGAVREQGGRKVVFVLEGSRARAAPVEAGAEGEDGTEILKGLLGGEVVVTGGDAVEDGAEVRVKEKR